MADEEDQPVTPVAPPPQSALPRGTGYTYSTPGPGNWQNPQTVAGPANVPVQIPQNAQNFTSIVGPPPEDQETAAFRKMFNSLPMDQAIKAYQAAKQFQGQRVLQSKLAGYSAAGLPPEQALSRAMTDAAAVGLFSTPKEMLDLHKTLADTSGQKLQQQRELALTRIKQQGELAKLRQEAITKRVTERRSGAMTDIDKESIRGLERQQDKAQSAADRLESQATTFTAPKMQKQMKDQAKVLSDRANQIQSQIDAIRGKYQPKPSEPSPVATEAASTKPARVKVRSKDGKVGTVPADQVEKAKKAGYVVIQ